MERHTEQNLSQKSNQIRRYHHRRELRWYRYVKSMPKTGTDKTDIQYKKRGEKMKRLTQNNVGRKD